MLFCSLFLTVAVCLSDAFREHDAVHYIAIKMQGQVIDEDTGEKRAEGRPLGTSVASNAF